MDIKYRPDIDGLRALAILSVLLFHLDMASVTGGYVGVDIFFVISGFLITSIILKDLSQNKFSLADFFERRIRRIFPALFTVLFTSLAAGYIFLFPQTFQSFGASFSASAGFGANILFWRQSGYFETEAHLIPLLHIWSLGVEEQFYILFPIGLLIIHKIYKRLTIPLIIMAGLISFLIAAIGLEFGKYSAVFYLLPARAWELLLGAILAFRVIPALKNKIALNGLSLIGTSLIIAAVFIYNDDTLFPGIAALAPTIGTALIIYAGLHEQTFITKILGNRVFVFIGKISYPLYLWHWPLIVFYKHYNPFQLNNDASLFLLGLSFTLSILTWKFIENPIRYNKNISQKFVFLAAAGISFLCIISGFFIYKSGGIPNRFPDEIQKLSTVSFSSDIPDLKQHGFEGNSGVLGNIDSAPSFIVWGDSHAQAVIPALDAIAKELDHKGYLLEDSGCMPAAQTIPIMENSCNQFNKQAIEFIISHPEINRIILIARWSGYANRFENNMYDIYMDEIFNILKQHKKDVYFVTEVPESVIGNPALNLARAKYYNQDIDTDTPVEKHLAQQAGILAALNTLSQKHDFNTLYPHEALCENDICIISHNGMSLYYDHDHLSTYGAMYIKNHYKKIFETPIK